MKIKKLNEERIGTVIGVLSGFCWGFIWIIILMKLENFNSIFYVGFIFGTAFTLYSYLFITEFLFKKIDQYVRR